jgi:hypothetical protein
MKHTLLGTTALVAAGLFVGEAYAAEGGVTLELGGRYYGTYGSHFDTQDGEDGGVDDSDLDRGDVVKQDVEVHFRGEAVLDNGLTVGARVELEGQTSADQIDVVFAYFSGGFGEFRVGDTADAYAQLCYTAPSATRVAGNAMFAADSPTFNFSNAGVFGYGGTNGTCYGATDNATKMVYFSPNFAGFSFALSYAPDGSEDTRNFDDGFGTRSDSDPIGSADAGSEEYSAALQFTHDFNGVNVAVGGGAAFIDDIEGDGLGFVDEGDLSKPVHYNAYAQVGLGIGDGMLTVGAAWALRGNQGNFLAATVVPGGPTVVTAVHDDLDDMIWAVGIVYGVDAWKIGASYSHGDYETACTDVLDDDECSDDYDIITVDANYALGPGVDVGAMVEWDSYDPGDGRDAAEYDALSAGLGLYIGF